MECQEQLIKGHAEREGQGEGGREGGTEGEREGGNVKQF